MKSAVSLGLALSACLLSGPAFAGNNLVANGSWVATPNGPNWSYSITLTNSSSSVDNLGTFWFGWQPGGDFLDSKPISEATPSGWTAKLTNFGSSDGWGIQWMAGNGSTLAPGQSLTFGFVSMDTPSQVAGFSNAHPGIHADASFVYQGAPFTTDGFGLIVAQAVPEPSSLALGVAAIAGTLICAGARRARTAWARRRST
jgi:hypothetical protein